MSDTSEILEDDEFELWLERLRNSDSIAESEFLALFGPRIQRVCERALGNLPRQAGAIMSPESKALSAIRSVMMGVQSGRYRSPGGETGLLRLLITIAVRKCRDAQRAHFAKARGGGNLRRVSDFQGEDSRHDALEQIGRILETPEFVVVMQERCDQLMNMLTDKDRLIAQKRLEGYTEEEIAALIGMSRRTVQLHIRGIRESWSEAAGA